MFNDQGHNYLVYIAKDKKNYQTNKKEKKGEKTIAYSIWIYKRYKKNCDDLCS